MTKPTVSKNWRKPVGHQRSGLNPTRTTPPCYNNTTLDNRLYAQRKGPNVTNSICLSLTCKTCWHEHQHIKSPKNTYFFLKGRLHGAPTVASFSNGAILSRVWKWSASGTNTRLRTWLRSHQCQWYGDIKDCCLHSSLTLSLGFRLQFNRKKET